MSGAWQERAPEERRADPRPGALLAAAGAVPVGVAVLTAAGLLPAGVRIVVGVAVVVLAVRLSAQTHRQLGARIGPAATRALALASGVAGGVLAAGGLAVALTDLVGGTSVAERFTRDGTLAGGTAAVVAVLVALLGAALLGVRPDRRDGRAVARPAAGDGAGVGRTAGLVLAGTGAALALPVLLGGDALGLADGPRTFVVLVVAALATVVGVRGAVDGRDEDLARGLLVAAGVLVALTGGEATRLVSSLVGPLADPSLGALEASGARGARTAVAAAIATVLLVTAVRRRDAVVGAVPLGVLLLVVPVEGTGDQVGALLVPGLVLLVVGAALLGAGPAVAVRPRGSLWAAGGAAALVLSAQAGFVLPGDRADPSDVVVVAALAAAAGLVVAILLAAATRRVPGRPGAACGVVLLVALVVLNPLVALQTAGPEDWGRSIPVALVVWLGTLLLVGAVLRHRREAVVLGTAVIVVATSTAQLAAVLVFRDGLDDGDLGLLLAVQVGPSVVLLLGAAIVALLGPAGLTARAQAAGAGAGYAAAIAAVGAAQLTEQLAGASPGGPLLDGGALVLAVLLLLLLAVGSALLAAGTARRPSAVVALVAAGGAVAGAVLVVAIGLAAADGGPADGPEGLGRSRASAVDLALGVRTVAGAAREVGAGWPVLFGILGALLLAAGWVLESRRPVPPGVPLG